MEAVLLTGWCSDKRLLYIVSQTLRLLPVLLERKRNRDQSKMKKWDCSTVKSCARCVRQRATVRCACLPAFAFKSGNRRSAARESSTIEGSSTQICVETKRCNVDLRLQCYWLCYFKCTYVCTCDTDNMWQQEAKIMGLPHCVCCCWNTFNTVYLATYWMGKSFVRYYGFVWLYT